MSCDDSIQCPVCNDELDLDDFSLGLDDEEIEVVCEKCGATIEISREVTVDYDVKLIAYGKKEGMCSTPLCNEPEKSDGLCYKHLQAHLEAMGQTYMQFNNVDFGFTERMIKP